MALLNSLLELIQRLTDDPTTMHCSIGGVQDLFDLLTKQLREHYSLYNILDPATWFAILMWILMVLGMVWKFLNG